MTIKQVLDGGLPNSETPTVPLTAEQRKTARQRASKAAGITKRASKVVAKPAPTAVDEPAAQTEEKLAVAEETACNAVTQVADSDHSEPETAPTAPQAGGRKMKLTFKSLNKRQTQAIYTGQAEDGQRAKTAVRFPLAFFEGKSAPQELTIDGPIALRGKARTEMTAEERKAARANRPKLTLAEKARKAEERAARLRQQLEQAAAQEPAAAQM